MPNGFFWRKMPKATIDELTVTYKCDEETYSEIHMEKPLAKAELASALGDIDIYSFLLSYHGSHSQDDGFLLKSGGTLFLFTGEKVEF